MEYVQNYGLFPLIVVFLQNEMKKFLETDYPRGKP